MTRVIAGRYAEIANTRQIGRQAEVLRAADLQAACRLSVEPLSLWHELSRDRLRP